MIRLRITGPNGPAGLCRRALTGMGAGQDQPQRRPLVT